MGNKQGIAKHNFFEARMARPQFLNENLSQRRRQSFSNLINLLTHMLHESLDHFQIVFRHKSPFIDRYVELSELNSLSLVNRPRSLACCCRRPSFVKELKGQPDFRANAIILIQLRKIHAFGSDYSFELRGDNEIGGVVYMGT